MPSRYEWPPDEVLAKAMEEKDATWLADQLDVHVNTLRSHLKRRGIRTTPPPRKLEMSEALRKVADLVKD